MEWMWIYLNTFEYTGLFLDYMNTFEYCGMIVNIFEYFWML